MAPFVATIGEKTATGANSIVPDLPAGVANGDSIMAWIASSDETTTVTSVPAGWNYLAGEASNGAGGFDLEGWHFIKDISDVTTEPASWTWNLSTSSELRADIVVVRGGYGSVSVVSAKIASGASPQTQMTGPSGLIFPPGGIGGLALNYCVVDSSTIGSTYTDPTNGWALSRVFFRNTVIGARRLYALCCQDYRPYGSIPAYNAIHSEAQEYIGLTVGFPDFGVGIPEPPKWEGRGAS